MEAGGTADGTVDGTADGTGTGTDDVETLAATRRSLHGVAELLIAGPQHRHLGTIRLVVVPGGFAGLRLPVRVVGTTLHWDGGSAVLAGSYRELAVLAGLDIGAPEDVYTDVTGIDPDEQVVLDAAAAGRLAAAWERGAAALTAFAPAEPATLWPEHFDVGISVDEVNYGVSPGDGYHATPYAYVGPWTPRTGDFWNAPFGAVRDMDDLPEVAAVADFFAEGSRQART
jgi:hypothetical protein